MNGAENGGRKPSSGRKKVRIGSGIVKDNEARINRKNGEMIQYFTKRNVQWRQSSIIKEGAGTGSKKGAESKKVSSPSPLLPSQHHR